MDVREKLVEIVCDAMEADGCIGHCNHPPCFAVERVVNALSAHGVTVQEWISVKDRLPEKSGEYIVCCDDSFCSYGEGIWYQSGVVVCAGVDVGINEGICWEWQENGTIYDLDGIVTHWMPLPKPPKGE